MSRRYLLPLLVLAAGLLLAAVLILPQLRPVRFTGAYLEPPKQIDDFTLTDQTGREVRLSDYRGRLVALYFGYTFCPDVCPTTMAAVAHAMRLLGSRSNEVQVAMITVDPERDTPAQLGTYLAHFDPRFIGLTGTLEQIKAAAAPFGVYFNRHAGTAASGYLVDHTASLFIVDREGRLRLILPYGAAPEEIASDLANLLR